MMTDPVFGNLEYEYGWNGTVEIDCFGKMEEIDLTVCGEEDTPITEQQRSSYKAFMAAWNGIRDDVAEEIGEYYISLREELGYDEEYNSCYPPIDHPSDVLGMISLDQMVIPDDGIYDGRSVCLAFSCSWDDENGMGIRFLNEKIDETGYQDIVF